MTLPFVSRERLIEAQQALRTAHAEGRIALNRADQRYDELLEKFTALRVAGAVSEPKPIEPIQGIPQKQDELKLLISEVCGRDYQRRQIMLRQLATDRTDGLDDETIAARIRAGVQSEGIPE